MSYELYNIVSPVPKIAGYIHIDVGMWPNDNEI